MQEKKPKKESSKEPSYLSRHIVGFILNHYGIIAAITTLYFSALCLIYTDSFLRAFDINFYHFGSFTDIYTIPLSQHIETIVQISAMLALSLIIIALSIGNTDTDNTKIKFLRPIKVTLYSVAAILVIVVLPFSLEKSALQSAQLIKDGHAPRYEINTQQEALKCRIFIGSTGQYLLLFVDGGVEIIPRERIDRIREQIESPPPSSLLRKKDVSAKKFDTMEEHNAIQQKDWAKKIKEVCNQDINW